MSFPQASLPVNPSDETPVPTTDRIAQDCQRFRILIIGRTGTGKSSLINAILKISLADDQDNQVGTADINKGITSEHNESLILHNSQGYEPDSREKFDILKKFIQERSHQEQVAERLHAIWLCIPMPFADNRIFEIGDEKIFQLDLNKVPIIVVFTKSDLFRVRMGSKMSQESAEKQFKEMYNQSFERVTRNMAGRIPYTLVAISRPETLQQLVKITMQSIHVDPTSPPFDRPTKRNQPTRLDEDLPSSAQIALATAQRADMKTKINASIRAGEQKYWKTIASSVFIGINFRSCLNVVHKDIVAIWNIRSLNQYLLSDKFRNLMMVIVSDLHNQNASASTNVEGKVSLAKRIINWSNIYQGSLENIRCLIGYVVDLTLIMQAVFQVSLGDQYEGEIKVDRVKEIVYEYYCSETKPRIHNTIRAFVKSPFAQNKVTERIESLISENRNDTEFNHSRPTLPSLLTILRIEHVALGEPKEISPISIILLCKLLDFQDYSGIASELNVPTDANLLLDFMLHVVRNGFLFNTGVPNANRKARKLMYKLINQTCVLPISLFMLNIRKPDSIGGFGQVYKGEYNGSEVALKVFYRHRRGDDPINKDFCRETLIWRSLSHIYILPLIGVYEEKSQTYLVSPYMKSGTLTNWRKKAQPCTAEIQQRMLEIAEGVRYIHSEGIAHGNLRGENVLIGSGPRCQITGFELTRHVDATVTRSQLGMSVNFAAPELFGACSVCGETDCESHEDGWEQKKTMATDIYAFGCLYYAIFFDRVPFLNKTNFQITFLVASGKRPSRLEEPRMESDVWNLIQRCWATNPSERPTMEYVVEKMTQHNSPFLLLPSMLRDRKPTSPITSVVNDVTVNLMRTLLSTENYVQTALHITGPADIEHLLDFVIYLICNGYLETPDANRRARRLILKLITKRPIIPKSWFVSGVNIKTNDNYISRGGFGFVLKGEVDGAPVALKALCQRRRDHASTRFSQDFCQEALTWRSLKHEFVLPFLGICDDESTSQLFIVSPYMENGTLSEWRRRMNPSEAADIHRLVSEVAEGVHYIHSEGLVHGDLRGDNVLLDANFHAQIADFGLTRHSEATDTESGAFHLNFAAPELIGYSDDDDDAQLTTRTCESDVYAFGCLYYEIHYAVIPFNGVSRFQIMKRVCRGERPPRLSEQPLSDGAWNLIECCWANESVRRPAIGDVVERMMACKST